MRATKNNNSIGEIILRESMRRGPVLSFGLMAILSLVIGWLVFTNLMSGWGASSAQYRQLVNGKEVENKKTERLLAGEDQFRAKFTKIVGLYEEAKPLLPEETEVSDVLGQVEAAARNNGVTLTGLLAVKESVKSPRAEQLYEREIPALVTGPYPQVLKFFSAISRMPRILVVRDYSVVSMKNRVSAGFTLVAFHAPPPTEKPQIPGKLTINQAPGNQKAIKTAEVKNAVN
ncbi:MAG: type 4a pilus biogenesis protein PilO [Acidobacteriota bacterium]|nr:type 4a pilus biogenesis protein PilO [Acidobacteriota bacterium]MDH3529492.1 type 4a pilus biogenesis protein PilO [Acidobacteriota bacterium]